MGVLSRNNGRLCQPALAPLLVLDVLERAPALATHAGIERLDVFVVAQRGRTSSLGDSAGVPVAANGPVR